MSFVLQFSILLVMSSIVSRQDLWSSLRSKHPKVPVKYSQTFVNTVETTLFDLFKFPRPLTFEQDQFLSNEVNTFSNLVPGYWTKAKANQRLMISRHKAFFEKAYPQFNDSKLDPPEAPQPKAPKRPYESKSRSQQWRDRTKITKNDTDAVIESAAFCFQKEGHHNAAFVVKRLHSNPDIGTELRKTITSIENEQNDQRLIHLLQGDIG